MLALEQISPDAVVLWKHGFFEVNATLLFTWVVIGVLALASWTATARIGKAETPARWETFLEVIVDKTRDEVRDVVHEAPEPYLPFVGGLFLFIGTANLLMIVPGFISPSASLSTTAALAATVFVAVPAFAVRRRGVLAYLRHYISPSVFMLPFHVISELSRTLAMAVRLFGNVMSGTKIAGLLLAIAPFFFPVIMQALGLLTGLIQAYIFAVLALIYIASAARVQEEQGELGRRQKGGENG